MQVDIQKAVEVLKSGGTILYPTDTIWGIGCDATREDATEKIFAIKERDKTKSMLILVSDIRMAERHVAEVSEVAMQLFDFATTPTTLILDNAINLANNILGPDGTIGIRIPDDDFCQALLRRFNKPIVSTSANFSGDPSPMCFDEISEELIRKVDFAVIWKRLEARVEKASSIIRLKNDGEIKILRK